MKKKKKIKEAIIVEGRDDADIVAKAVEAIIIPTHGFGITKETWDLIEKAYMEKGIIILTDPDFSGEEIRRKISRQYKNAKHAFIAREKATKGSDIGVENAKTEDIIKAIEKAGTTNQQRNSKEIAMQDLQRLGLIGEQSSKKLRSLIGEEFGIGYGNGKMFLKKLNGFGIEMEALEKKIIEKAKEI